MNERRALVAGHESANKLKNAKAAAHSVVASAREHKDDVDDDADQDDTDGSGANSRAATKVDQKIGTVTPRIRNCAIKSIILERITPGLHERVIIFRNNPISVPLSLFSRKNQELRLSPELKDAQRVGKEALAAITCTEKNN
ncbi:unnamed protein product [Sphagnum tenellum]